VKGGGWQHRVKRAGDVALVLVALPVAVPLGLAVAILVRWRLGRPVLFSQLRAGQLGRPVRIWKFRSMSEARDAGGNLLADEHRLGRFGGWLRSTSLDELPQLWNILRGDLSWVGPRPLLLRYVARYSPAQARRLLVRPGLTGWAQIHGRNALDWECRLELDVWYVDHWTLRLDGRILAGTVLQVLRRADTRGENSATMEEFRGSGGSNHVQ